MIQIKKTILTLALLITAVGGAWAQGPWTSGDCTVTISGDVMTVSGAGAMADYADTNLTPWYGYCDDIKTIVIESGVTSIGKFDFSRFEKLESVSIPASVTSIGESAFGECGTNATNALTVSFAEGSKLLTIGLVAFRYANLKSIDIPNGVTSIGEQAFYNCSNLESVSIPASVTSIGSNAFYDCSALSDVYLYANPDNLTWGDASWDFKDVNATKCHVLAEHLSTYQTKFGSVNVTFVGDLQPLASSGPEVAWDKATKTGTFTMPGGNVTLEPEYYPQATVADGGVTAADADARATTDDPLVKVDATKLTGATKLMYFVSNSGTTAPAYDAEGWTDQLPTAEGFTQQGIVYVWYYPVGTDEGVDEATATYSDGDICLQSITARIAAAPTYAVTFADDTDEPTLWKAQPAAGVKKGTAVTVTYTGSRKVIGVKAEKKAKAVPVETITLNKTATSIKVGATETLSVTAVAPDNATDKTYTWKTSDESKATVDQDGKVTAVAAGTVTIYAEANDGSGVKGNCTVTVTPATITVTWNNDDITGTWGTTFTKDGVTITVAGFIDFNDKNFMDGGTFTTTLGNFTKIEVSCGYCGASGTGWSGNSKAKTWTGNASSVSFSGDFMGMGQGNTKFVFTIEPTN